MSATWSADDSPSLPGDNAEDNSDSQNLGQDKTATRNTLSFYKASNCFFGATNLLIVSDI
jgi:hypothetical protein